MASATTNRPSISMTTSVKARISVPRCSADNPFRHVLPASEISNLPSQGALAMKEQHKLPRLLKHSAMVDPGRLRVGYGGIVQSAVVLQALGGMHHGLVVRL